MNDLSLVININKNDLVIMLLAIYTIVESFSAVCNMPEGYQMFCHKAKYAMAVVMSAAAIAFAFEHSPTYFNYMVLGMQLALTLFVWPRTVFRVKQYVAIFRDWPHLQ
jgi:fumarate reductase subunit C